MNTMTEKRDSCIRCGDCCRGSSPSLQAGDISLIKDGFLERKDLFTIRPGEIVRDNIYEELRPAEREIIKVRERDGACIFYDEGGNDCRIYVHRPVQCAALECWDSKKFMEAYSGPKACREDIIRDGVLLGLIREHERKCGYARLEHLVRQIESAGKKAVEEILGLLKFDYHLRPFVAQKTGIDPDETDLIFGRPLVDTISQFGLQVIQKADGSFFLTTMENPFVFKMTSIGSNCLE